MKKETKKNADNLVLSDKELQSVIDNCKFKPARYTLLITVNQLKPEGLEIVSNDNTTMLDEWQYVVSAGEGSDYKPGDKIYLNLAKLIKRVPDPNDRMNFVEQLDIMPFDLDGTVLTLIPDAYVFGGIVSEDVDLKA